MDLINKIAIYISSKKIGNDEFGNSYFESKKVTNNNKKRFVVYNGLAEPSKIPSNWHSWLHYTTNTAPVNINLNKHSWQKIHLPNLTGTKFSYFPSGSKKIGGHRSKVSSDYQSWVPNLNK
jgi:NADH:ubiquinone oxidoreductase subunit